MTTLTRNDQLTDQILREFERCRSQPFPFLLESALATPGGGGLSMVGADPFAVLVARDRNVEFFREGTQTQFHDADPFEVLRQVLAELAAEGKFLAVGYLGYDLGAHVEHLPRKAKDDQDFPDMVLAFYDRFHRGDHTAGTLTQVNFGRTQVDDGPTQVDDGPTQVDASRLPVERFSEGADESLGRGHSPVTQVKEGGGGRRARAMSEEVLTERFVTPGGGAADNFTKAEYLRQVQRVRELIEAGEIYQVNLSQRFGRECLVEPGELYLRLREASPAPYAAFLGFGNHAVISSSPEEFLSKSGRRVQTTPIKGTRRRGRTQDEDERLRQELWDSAKDAAELTMIVDLERNDLGRVCEPGSVVVARLKQIEAHPTVWHLSSTVEGRLEAGRDVVDLLRATFPGGSVTGAPKIRAMEIIDELEPTRRGAFTGAMVWLTDDGELGSSIAIRTIQLHDRWATFQVGGAIVWDSDPQQEYEETLVKARGMAQALGIDL